MAEGKFFYIASRMNDLCLDIEHGALSPGTPVITWDWNGHDHQLWSIDYAQQVIRSKADENYVMEIQGDTLVVNEYDPDQSNQKWRLNGDKVESLDNPDMVLDLAECNCDPGARICSWEYSGEDNQHWAINYVGPVYCFIRSVAKDDKVMDVKGDDDEEGGRIILYKQKDEDYDNQLFYEDRHGYIHNRMTDFCFDTYDEGKLRMREFDADLESQRWVRSGNKIVHRDDTSQCLQVKDGGLLSKPKVEIGEYSGDQDQRWTFEYI